MDGDSATAVRTAVAEQEALISGSEAVAVASKLADVDVITAYPIRPYDTMMQFVAKQIANGEQDAEYIVAESEHSQFEIAKHANVVGARTLCGSSGVGWCYAFEAIAVTPALRLPLIAMVGNRALDDPGAFGTEHNDALAARDLGWLHVWVDTAQEALDTTLMAYRVAEDRRVYLPVAISTDGAFLTHSQSLVKVPPRSWVDKFLPPYNRGNMVFHPDNPITIAPQVNEDWLMEIRRQTDEAMRHAHGVIEEAWKEFRAIFGRGTGSPFFEEYYTDDGRSCSSAWARSRCPCASWCVSSGNRGRRSGSCGYGGSDPSTTTGSVRCSPAFGPSASSTGTSRWGRRSTAVCSRTRSARRCTRKTGVPPSWVSSAASAGAR